MFQFRKYIRFIAFIVAFVILLPAVFVASPSASSLDTYVAPGEHVHLTSDYGFENVVAVGADLDADAIEAPTCQEIHDGFVAQAQDGNWYHTWHPMSSGGCYFGHEHGNDPGSVVAGFQPWYGYVNEVHQMQESHHGFKTYALYDTDGRAWIVTQHQGTTTDNALCGRFHGVEIAVFEGTTMKARLQTMADFGFSRLGDTSTRLSPPKCDGDPEDPFPNNATINSQGLRRIPTYGTGGGDGYTPYLVNMSVPELGLRFRSSFLTTNGRTGCPDANCDPMFVNQNNAGDRRRFQTLGTESISINLDVVTNNSGWFQDSMGVWQYIEPGFSDRLEACMSTRVANGSNGCWYWDTDGTSGPLTKEQQPMRAAVDVNGFNGSSLGFPLEHFVEN